MRALFQKKTGIAISVIAIVSAAILIALTHARLDSRPRTDDAFIQADLIHMAPDVGGRIVSLQVENNHAVHAGDILFIIDPEPYQLEVDQAAARVAALTAEVNQTTDTVSSQVTRAEAAKTSIGSAESQLSLATVTLNRIAPLRKPGFVTAEQVDQARTQQQTASISLEQARLQALEAKQAVTSTEPAKQQLVAAKAALTLAQRNLRLTTVRSPCDGLISGLDTSAGEYAVTGKPVFTIIDTGHWYAVGNFRETDLDGLQLGQKATIYILGQPGRPVHGSVESIGWGVVPDEGAETEGLPRVPRTLSWVRISQRFPVRILLDQPPPDLMRIAATAVVVIDR